MISSEYFPYKYNICLRGWRCRKEDTDPTVTVCPQDGLKYFCFSESDDKAASAKL